MSSSLELLIRKTDPNCFRFILAEELFDVLEDGVDTATHKELLEGQLEGVRTIEILADHRIETLLLSSAQ